MKKISIGILFNVILVCSLYGQSFQIALATESGFAYGNAIIQTHSGSYVVAGSNRYEGREVPFIAKFDEFGTVVWSKAIVQSSFVPGNSLIQTSDGGYLLSGGQLIKFDSLFQIEWYKF
jgi:hypothetical protein